MLYSFIRSLIRLSLSVFFKKFNVIGQENIPTSGPVIFVANHPSAVMDPLIVGVALKKKIHFLAGAEWMGEGRKAKFYRKNFNMIPVHRPWLAEGKKVDNRDMFEGSYENLSNDDWILIFPEATTKTISKIRELKTGAIRIKEGFEKLKNHEVNVPIIPVGINYSNPHRFQSNVIVNIGKEIKFEDSYEGLNSKEQARVKTNKIQTALENCIININRDDNKSLIRKVNQLFIDTYREEKGLSSGDSSSNFEFLQKVASAIGYFEEKKPSDYNKVSHRINSYFERMNKLGFKSDMVSTTNRLSVSLINAFALFLGLFPAVASGLIFAFPYFTSKLVFRKKLKSLFRKEEDEPGLDPAFTGSLMFLSGVLIYLVWSIVFSIVASQLFGDWKIGMASMLLTFAAYRYYLFYLRNVLQFQYGVTGMVLKRKYKKEHQELCAEKEALIELLKKYQKEFRL